MSSPAAPKDRILPRHVGIIPDGNRRWAARHGVPFDIAYQMAADRLGEIVRQLFECGVAIVSIYGLSKENLGRPSDELDVLYRLAAVELSRTFVPICAEFRASLRIVGDRPALPAYLARFIDDTEKHRADSSGHAINLCIPYSPWDEIWQACARAASKEEAQAAMWVTEPVDLTIRTGGLSRLSNFLLLQSGYATLVTIPELLNDVTETHIEAALGRYASEEQNGGL
jgi:undecaprenyl diphosphate synthase